MTVSLTSRRPLDTPILYLIMKPPVLSNQNKKKKEVRPEKTVSAQNGSLSAAESEPLAIDYYRNTETASGVSFFNCYLGI